MKPDIKQRIEQIRQGEVPKGYKKTKAGVMPEEWEEILFDSAFKIIGNNTLSRKELNSSDGMIQNIHYGDILIKFNEILDCKKEKIPFINSEVKIKKTVFLKDGDIIFADTAEDYTVGKMIEVINVGDRKVVAGLHTIPCTPLKKYGKKWLGYFCNSSLFHNQILPLVAGAKVSSISKSSLKKLTLISPPLSEQQKIADILTTQDKVIELKEQLLAQKQQQKKYLMQQLLTGKKRLPGFSGEWRKEQVRNLCTVVKGEQLNKDILDEIGLYYVLNGGMTPSGYTNKWNIMENTISISEGGNSCGYVNFNREKFWSGGHCYTLQFVKTSEIMNLFLYFYLKFCENKLQCLRVGSGLPNIQKSSLENFNVTYPTLEEQTAIADVLSSADREIDLLRQNIKSEKQKKKALMQLLLTGIVRVTV